MLVQFSVGNFLSFDDEQVFSMVATSDDQHIQHLVSDVPKNGEAVLRGAAIYGANAAGKSNLIESMRFAQSLITTSMRDSQAIPVRPFKLKRTDAKRPSKFEFVIKTQGVVYNYGFRVDAHRVWDEWLFATPNKQEVLYFQRTTSRIGKVKVVFGKSLTGRTAKQKQFLEFVAQGTGPNQLFFTRAVDNKVATLQSLFHWFEKVLMVISAEDRFKPLEIRTHHSKPMASFFASFLKSVGTGIDDIETKLVAFDFDRYTPDMPIAQREDIREQVSQMDRNVFLTLERFGGERHILMRGRGNEIKLVLLMMQHHSADGSKVSFSLQEESEGTDRLINILPLLFSLKHEDEKVVVLDELDRRLHTLLSRLFIQIALDCDDKHRQSQLIFTTHDTNLLDLELLRRDEIWFVEKDQGGASQIRSLAEYKIRPEFKAEKGYLSGRFGALPFFGDPRRLGLTDNLDERDAGTEQQKTPGTLHENCAPWFDDTLDLCSRCKFICNCHRRRKNRGAILFYF